MFMYVKNVMQKFEFQKHDFADFSLHGISTTRALKQHTYKMIQHCIKMF